MKKRTLAAFGALLLSGSLLAHHSWGGIYDLQKYGRMERPASDRIVKDGPSWPGGVSAPKAQTGWWFKLHENVSQGVRVIRRDQLSLKAKDRQSRCW